VRAHDEPGLLWRIGRALGECGLNVQAARVETLGAEAVDVFYVTDAAGGLLTNPDLRRRTAKTVLEALTSALPHQAAKPAAPRPRGLAGQGTLVGGPGLFHLWEVSGRPLAQGGEHRREAAA